jgi:fatty acid desaturase
MAEKSEKMDHRRLVAGLSLADRTRLTAKSDRAGLLHLSGHLGAIAVLGTLITLRVPYWPVLMLPQGILIVFLFTLLHEAIHRTPFASPWLNDVVARFCSFALALPSDWFRAFHFAHHRFTQDPENDPELARPKPQTWRQYLRHVSGLPLWRSHFRQLWVNATGRCRDSFVTTKGQAEIRAEARLMLLGYVVLIAASVYFRTTVLLYAWVVPALLGQPFLRLYLLAEHGGCPYVGNMLLNSRTTMTTWLVRKLAWNMPYHAEHHAFPGVPFHLLPEFHKFTRPHLGVIEPGYVHFHRFYVDGLR